MSCDSHQVATNCHHVAQKSKMAIVHIGTIERDHMMQLLLQSLSHCLNTQHLIHSESTLMLTFYHKFEYNT